MTTDTMTIRQMCDAFDVTPRTLRFYEAKELLAPERKGTRRLFTRRDRTRLKMILRGKKYGLSLEDIRQLLDLYQKGSDNTEQLARAYQMGRARLEEMEKQRAELDVLIEDLSGELDWGDKMLASKPDVTAA